MDPRKQILLTFFIQNALSIKRILKCRQQDVAYLFGLQYVKIVWLDPKQIWFWANDILTHCLSKKKEPPDLKRNFEIIEK